MITYAKKYEVEMKLLLLSVYDSNVNINKCYAPVICLQSRIMQ